MNQRVPSAAESIVNTPTAAASGQAFSRTASSRVSAEVAAPNRCARGSIHRPGTGRAAGARVAGMVIGRLNSDIGSSSRGCGNGEGGARSRGTCEGRDDPAIGTDPFVPWRIPYAELLGTSSGSIRRLSLPTRMLPTPRTSETRYTALPSSHTSPTRGGGAEGPTAIVNSRGVGDGTRAPSRTFRLMASTCRLMSRSHFHVLHYSALRHPDGDEPALRVYVDVVSDSKGPPRVERGGPLTRRSVGRDQAVMGTCPGAGTMPSWTSMPS
jgi:hypothetical protein